jgi:hypothetical protein
MGTAVRSPSISSSCSSCPACLSVCSPEYVALVQRTQDMDKGELQALSGQYDAVYFHPVRAPTQLRVRTPVGGHTYGCQPANVPLVIFITMPVSAPGSDLDFPAQ